jgi:amidase
MGLTSRAGVVPLSLLADIAGPMARTVADAATVFQVVAGEDPDDPATAAARGHAIPNYSESLQRDGLKGARIGIPRAFYYDKTTPPEGREGRGGGGRGGPGGGGGGLNPEQARVMTEAIAILKQQGAIIVDPADIPSIVTKDPDKNLLAWGQCGGNTGAKGKDANCSVVLKYGMKRDFNKFLATLGPTAPVKSLTELRQWNITHTQAGAIRYGQSNLDVSDEMDVEADRARYEADRAKDIEIAGTHGIDEAMKSNNLDAILFPGANGAAIAAKPGYPTVIVPFGMVPNAPTPPFPAGFDAKQQPFGVSFTGTACSEPKLIELAYAFERATKRRALPPSTP